jgi:ABC-type amino acid transport substrate-binding protein
MKDVKAVVPNGLVTKDNVFYRWNNDIEMTGYGSAALSSGEFVSNWDLKLGLTKVCDNAERIFPYEYLTKVYGHTDENKAQNIYGFVQNSSGKLFGFSSKYHKGFGTYSNKVERIFPVFSSVMDGNFVGIKIENQSNIDVIACRICDGNVYRSGPLVGGAAYVCETQGGYYGADGKVYGLDIEIAAAYAAANNLNLVIKNIDFDAIFTQVDTGLADIGMAGITVSEERELLYDFTDTYFAASQKLIVSADCTDFDECKTAADVETVISALQGKKIGYQNATTGGMYVVGDDDWGFAGFANVSGKGYATAQDALMDLINGNLYAIVVDEAPAKALVDAVN